MRALAGIRASRTRPISEPDALVRLCFWRLPQTDEATASDHCAVGIGGLRPVLDFSGRETTP